VLRRQEKSREILDRRIDAATPQPFGLDDFVQTVLARLRPIATFRASSRFGSSRLSPASNSFSEHEAVEVRETVYVGIGTIMQGQMVQGRVVLVAKALLCEQFEVLLAIIVGRPGAAAS
jgi:hypothetical protein